MKWLLNTILKAIPQLDTSPKVIFSLAVFLWVLLIYFALKSDKFPQRINKIIRRESTKLTVYLSKLVFVILMSIILLFSLHYIADLILKNSNAPDQMNITIQTIYSTTDYDDYLKNKEEYNKWKDATNRYKDLFDKMGKYPSWVDREWLENEMNMKFLLSPLESDSFYLEFDEAMKIFYDEQDYYRSRFILSRLANDSNEQLNRETIQGLITATYYVEGSHLEGLAYIEKLYDGLPLDDIRYRWAIHAHVRKIALESGYEEAERIVSNHYKTSGRTDFSVVWPGIPLGKMEYLRKGISIYEESLELQNSDKRYLNRIIKTFPFDAFIDHAYYFLQRFRYVKDNLRSSIIYDINLIAYAIFLAVRDRHGEAAEIYTTLLRIYPNHDKRQVFERRAIRNFAKSGDLANLLKAHSDFDIDLKVTHINVRKYYDRFVSRVGLDTVLALLKDNHLLSLIDPDSEDSISLDSSPSRDELLSILDGNSLSGTFAALKEHNLLAPYSNIDDHEWTKYLDTGEEYYRNRDYTNALNIYKRQHAEFVRYGLTPPARLRLKIEELTNIIRLMDDTSAQGLLSLGLYLKNEVGTYFTKIGRNSHAIQYFRKCADEYPNTIEAEKALYLIGRSSLSIGVPGAGFAFRQLASKYPNSHLADDAYCELGRSMLFGDNWEATAMNEFDVILKNYPKSNSADNALNWIAWAYLNDDKYFMAVKYYTQLATTFAGNRLGKNATKTLAKLKKVTDASVQSPSIEGLSFWDRSSEAGAIVWKVRVGSNADEVGFRRGDVILNINGIETSSAKQLTQVLSSYGANDTVLVAIRRNRDIKRYQVPLSLQHSFPVKYNQFD